MLYAVNIPSKRLRGTFNSNQVPCSHESSSMFTLLFSWSRLLRTETSKYSAFSCPTASMLPSKSNVTYFETCSGARWCPAFKYTKTELQEVKVYENTRRWKTIENLFFNSGVLGN